MASAQPFDPGHNDRVTVCAVSFDGKLMLTGSIDHRIKVWELDSTTDERTLVDTFTAHDADIKAVSQYPDPLLKFQGTLVVHTYSHLVVKSEDFSDK